MAARSPVRRTLIIIGSVGALLCLLPYGWIRWARSVGERACRAELELARKEGIPTTPAEFAALIPRAEPHENAALHYKKLEGLKVDIRKTRELFFALTRSPSDHLIEQAQDYLSSFSGAMSHLEAGTTLPKCWFDRDWSRKRGVSNTDDLLEAMVTTPTRADQVAAEILPLRGTVRMLRGDAEGAIDDAEKMFKMASHYRQEPSILGQSVGWRLEYRALETLTSWCYARRGDPVYQAAIDRNIDRLKPYDPWASGLQDLSNLTYVLDRCWTSEGRAELGIEKLSLRETISLSFAPPDTKTRIVRAFRELMVASKLPHPDRWRPMRLAGQRAYEASRPLEGTFKLIPVDPVDNLEQVHVQDLLSRVCFRAVARALQYRAIPRTLKTDDLISPMTGRPVEYSFDGAVIRVSGGQRHPHRFVVKVES